MKCFPADNSCAAVLCAASFCLRFAKSVEKEKFLHFSAKNLSIK